MALRGRDTSAQTFEECVECNSGQVRPRRHVELSSAVETIDRSVRVGFLAKRQTKRLMATDVVETSLSSSGVLDAVDQTVGRAPAVSAGVINSAIGRSFRYRVEHRAGGASADIKLEIISNKTGDLSQSVTYTSRLTIRIQCEPANQGRTRVSVVTAQAVTVEDKIAEKKAHEHLREDLLVVLRAHDPGLQVIISRHSDESGSELAADVPAGAGRIAPMPQSTTTRACPFCAEDIKLEAKLCRFCGQAVPAFEAPPPPRPDELSDDDRSALADEFGATFDEALVLMDGLDGRPANPAAWLRELCSRMRAGSTPELAAQRIPLSWPNR